MTDRSSQTGGPLAGLRVLDLSWGMPSSVATMLLADYGAEVIKVERPRRDGTTPVLDKILERGKWRLALDSSDDATADTLDALIARSDVVLRSDGSSWPGIDVERIAQDHPYVVQAVLSAYGEGGPHAGRPGYDALVAARMGLMAEQRGHRDGPIFLGHPSVDYVTGFLLVIGVLAAVRARRHTGRGQVVDTSMLDGALALSTMNWWWNERGFSYLAREDSDPGAGRFGRTRLITDKFECADGQFIMIHTGGLGGFYTAMQVLGLETSFQQVEGADMATPLDDDEVAAVRDLVPKALRSRPRDEWIRAFHDADLAALPVLRPEEVFDDDQVVHAGIAVDVDDPDLGTIRQIGPVVHFESSPASPPQPTAAPGQHNGRIDELLAEPRRAAPSGLSDDATSGGATLAGPLDGIRILDFSAYFATAFGVRLLSDLGADVIKVEPPAGEQMRPLADLYEAANRGKRNLAIDLRTPEGRDAIERLVRSADAVVHNFRPGKAEKLGIGPDQLRELNPEILSFYLPGFGSTGPKSGLKSFAPLVSGFTGMLYIGAGDGNEPIERVMGNEDLYNGFSGAMAILMALVHKEHTGEGQHVESPHLHSSLLVRTEHAVDAQGRALPGLQLDADQTGWGPLYRLHRTSDGWIVIAAVGQRAFERLVGALDRPDLLLDDRFATPEARSVHADELTDVLVGVFAQLPTEAAFARLDAADVPCEIPASEPKLPEFLWDEWALETGRVYEHHHPEHGWIREIGQCVRLSGTPALNKGTSARLGQHTRQILGELGYDEAGIESLLDATCRSWDPT